MTRIEKILAITDRNKDIRRRKIINMVSNKREVYVQIQGETKNIIVAPEYKPDIKIAFMAHYDVYPGSLGYNDNSSGVVALLNIIDELPFVEFVFSDNEEIGGLGASLYVHTHFPDFVIAVDVVGIGDTIFYENTYMIDVPSFVSNEWKDKMLDVGNAIFHDAKIVAKYGIPSALIISEYKKNKNIVVEDIFRYQHCGSEDNKIEHLVENQIEMVEKFLVEFGKNLYNNFYEKEERNE